MTLYPPLYQQNDSYSANLDRQLMAWLAEGVGAQRETVAALAVSQRAAGANMSVDVAAGKVTVVGSDTAGQGNYLCWSDAVVNVPIAASPPAGQSRIDLIVAQVRDATVIGGTNNDWTPLAVTGVPAATGTQVAPAVPNSAVLLAQVAVGPTVANIVNANITDKRPPPRLEVCRNSLSASWYRTAAWTTGSAVSTFNLDTKLWDPTDNGWAQGYDGASYHCQVAGRYRVTFAAGFSSSAAGQWWWTYIYQNAAVKKGVPVTSVNAGTFIAEANGVLKCAVGDTITPSIQCSTAGLAGQTGAGVSRLDIEYLGY